MKRAEMLDAVKTIVTKDRQADHGKPEDSFGDIRGLWAAYLGQELSSADVANMMILLKVARAKTNPKHQNNWVDMAGYAACGCEIATTPAEPEKVWHYSHLCKRLCGNDEPNSSGTEIANRVTCPACLEKMLEITKESMGFGKDVTFKEKRTDPLVPNGSVCRVHFRATEDHANVCGAYGESTADLQAFNCMECKMILAGQMEPPRSIMTSRVRPMLNSEECRSYYGCFFVAGPDGQVIYDVLDVLEVFDDWWPYVGNTTLPCPENIGKDCFIYRELNFKESHVRMLCNIYKKWKEAGKCA